MATNPKRKEPATPKTKTVKGGRPRSPVTPEVAERQGIPTLTVGARGRITLPANIREQLQLEAGSLLLLVMHNDDQGQGVTLELIPAAAVPRDQAYFYRPEVQAGLDEPFEAAFSFSSREEFAAEMARLALLPETEGE